MPKGCYPRKPRNKVPIESRFWSKTNKNSGHFGADGTYPTECHEWIAGTDSHKYGIFWDNDSKRMLRATHVSWKLHSGEIPGKKCVLHKCDNPPCIRFDHLFLGTKAQNIADMMAKGRHRTISKFGEANPFSKLTDKEIREIRQLYKNGVLQKELAKMFGVLQNTISGIVNYKSWRHIP